MDTSSAADLPGSPRQAPLLLGPLLHIYIHTYIHTYTHTHIHTGLLLGRYNHLGVLIQGETLTGSLRINEFDSAPSTSIGVGQEEGKGERAFRIQFESMTTI